ncbi:MAG: M14 family metallopeptidase [Alistipes sp.]|nr:M14 family metallopeptidase [Alistipes sp.]
MKRLLTICALMLLMGTACTTTKPSPEELITLVEQTDFVQTPKAEQTMAYFQKLADYSPMVNLSTFGQSAQGRDLVAVVLDKDGLQDPEKIRKKGRAIILVESCIHSGEPDGKDATMIFIRDMIVENKDIELLDNVSFLFIPILNIDGHEDFRATNRINQNGPAELGTRNTAQQLNLNRDFLKADAPEMRAWLKLYNEWMPELFIDVHVTNGADFQYVTTYAIENHGTMMEEGLRQWTTDVFEKQLNEQMTEVGFPMFLYASFRNSNAPEQGIFINIYDPRYSEAYAAARNRIGLLLENHIYKPYKQRVMCTIEAIRASARIIGQNKEELFEVVERADKAVSSPEYRRKPMDLTYKAVNRDSVWIDYLAWERETVKSDLSGADWTRHNYDKPITVKAPLITSYDATSSVQLPEAYIFMPQWTDVIELFDLHDIKYTRLTEPKKIEVETYRYNGATFSTRQSEGRIPVVKTDYTTQTETLEYPAGSILIDMNQPSGRIAAWLLEPSAPGSLVYWGFFNQVLQPTNEFWIRLGYMEEKGRELLAKDPALKAEFDERMKDPVFAGDSNAILNFFYERVRKAAHQNNEVHPAWRVMDRSQL